MRPLPFYVQETIFWFCVIAILFGAVSWLIEQGIVEKLAEKFKKNKISKEKKENI